ncbi:MAG: hypothetical protein M1835_002176 [Candelina submexicana]|nr:MAG: hypothetical protein M1835_002176 [Candelina submexicana]
MFEQAIRKALDKLSTVDPAYILRGFFLLASGTILIVNSIPTLRSRFLAYGPRSSPPSIKEIAHTPSTARTVPTQRPSNPSSSSLLTSFLDEVSTWTVPHSYFEHFYLTSIFFSLFWLIQFVSAGRIYRSITSSVPERATSRSMSQEQILITWILMLIQGSRRLYECIAFAKPSQTRMWVVHWLLGTAFYIAMSMAVWIEGIPVLPQRKSSLDSLILAPPSLRTFIAILIFIFASGIQHDCHVYLSSLAKYTIPRYPAFANLICPHYTAECCIYLSLSLLAAPKGDLVNKTIFSALVFVVINLGITAELSREWYMKRFGEKSIMGKRRMIPLIY